MAEQPLYYVVKDGKRVTAALPLEEAQAELDRLRKAIQEALTEGTTFPVVELKQYLKG